MRVLPMDKKQETVIIKCFDRCVYQLVYPDFFLTSNKPTLRKIFKYLFRFDWRNEETIEFFERELPGMKILVEVLNAEKIAEAEKNWIDRVNYYNREWQDPKGAATQTEKQRIKECNAALHKRVQESHATFIRVKKQAQKDLERVSEILAIYQEAKTK